MEDEYKYTKLCDHCQKTILYYSKVEITDNEIKLCSPCIKIFYINNNKQHFDGIKYKGLQYNKINLYKKN